MVDIRLISILPYTQGVTPTGTVSQGNSSNSPPLLNLPTGSVLSGFIVNRDTAGNPILRTDSGDVTFQTNIFLKIGTEVVVRIGSRAGAPTANIVSINGQPPPATVAGQPVTTVPADLVTSGQFGATSQQNVSTQAQAQPANAPPAATPAAQVSTPPQTASAPVTGQFLSASLPPDAPPLTFRVTTIAQAPNTPAPTTVTSQTPGTSGAPPSAASYAAYGTTTQTPITTTATAPATAPLPTTGATPPAATGTPASAVATPVGNPATPSAAVPSAPPQTPASPVVTTNPPTGAPNSTQIPGTPAGPTAVPLTAATTPVAPTNNVPLQPIPTVGQNVTGVVLGREPSGDVLVQTPSGILRLQNVSLPQGSQVTLQVQLQTQAAQAQPPAPLAELARQWTSLQHIATLLASRPDASLPWLPVTPLAQGTPAGAALPQNMSAGLLLFIAALRGGDFRNWLGEENVRFLQQTGHGQLLQKAEAEFMGMSRAFNEAQAQPHQWQSLFFPVAVDGQVQQVRMFLKRDRREGKKEDSSRPDDDTRFIVEVSLSQMGEMQMDGFVRRHPEDVVEFDLFIRSLVPVPPQMQQEILGIYNSIGELTGYKGSLAFQAVREFPVNPMKEALSTPGSVLA